jgi:oxygen-independent coproporphyrinogen-3 oxidase
MAGLYIHIPFCASKCIYCDFYSLAGSSHDTGQYVDALVAELKLRHRELAEPLRTLYVGGGTPSLLPLGQFARLVDAVGRVAPLDSVEEFTVEVNPDDVTAGYIAGLKELGVNRISMGVQSFDDRDLRFINRRHTARQAIEAVRAIRQAGVHNVSIDLIYGIPGQTLDSWSRTVDQAVALGVEHISAYSLMYEQGTRLWVMRQTGKVAEVDDDTCVAMYDLLVSRLHLAGYGHYEISNFALPGYCSRHNSSYWDLTPLSRARSGCPQLRWPCASLQPAPPQVLLAQLARGQVRLRHRERDRLATLRRVCDAALAHCRRLVCRRHEGQV